MRVYTHIVIDMATSEVIDSAYFEYTGPISKMKGGGGGDAIDEAYNAGMLKISQEQQGMAGEMFNMYKWGVPYDPYEQVQVSGGEAGETIPNPEYAKWKKAKAKYERWQKASDKQQDKMGWSPKPGPAPSETIVNPAPAKFITRGEQEGYNPADYMSQMELEQMSIGEQAELLPFMTGTQKSQLELQRQQAEAAAGILPLQTQTAEQQLLTQQAGLGLTREKLASEGRLLPEEEQTKLNELQLKQQQLASEGRTLPAAEAAQLANLEQARTFAESETGLIGVRGATEQAGLGLQRAQIGARITQLPGETALGREQTAARRSLLPGETELSRLGTTLGREQIGARRSLLPAETELAGAQLGARLSLLPGETGLSREQTQQARQELKERSPVVSELYRQALAGPDVARRTSEALAGVEQQFAGAEGQIRREKSRLGLLPDTGEIEGIGLAKAKTKAGLAAEVAREAEKERFQRLAAVA